jgi:hypothetical protein
VIRYEKYGRKVRDLENTEENCEMNGKYGRKVS